MLVGGRLAPSVAHGKAGLSSVPEVERLVVTTLVDAYFDMLAPDEARANVEVKRARGLYRAQHGLSLHLESNRGSETRRVLLDFGWTPDVLTHNLKLLGIDPAALDALVVSHGHLDHFGGLIEFLKQNRPAMKPKLALYAGGEDAFCYRYTKAPDGSRRGFGVLDRTELEAAKLDLVISPQPVTVGGHAFTTGAIERTSIEKVIANTTVETGKRGTAGCAEGAFAGHFTKEELAGKFLFDNHFGEHATCYNVKGRGLVVMSSCGHAGIINSVRQARKVSGVEKVHAVLGGFHLAPAKKDYVEKIVDAMMKELDPDFIIPMHCTGTTFIHMVAAKYPDKLIDSFVGTRFVFRA
jgi:7,8-dihydropterin-6-yl-methyl-4-(beta-D-ribofuranosyl)aminobenzene 5'-phosphate synthase